MVLPIIVKQHDAIMIILDYLRNATHFILVMSTFKVVKIEKKIIKEFSKLHGIPTAIISHIDLFANYYLIFGCATKF